MGTYDLDDEMAMAEGEAAGVTFTPRRRRLDEFIDEALLELERFQHKDYSQRVPTGIPPLDACLGGGWRKGSMSLIGAVTGGGKTSILQMLAAVCAKDRGPVLFVSPEMGGDELAERELIRRSGFSKWDRQSHARAEQAKTAHEAAAMLMGAEQPDVFILDAPDVTMSDVELEADDMAKTCGLAMVCVDYAQQVADVDPRKPRYMTVGEVAHRSIAMARRLRIPVVVASQVNVVEVKRGKKLVKEYRYRESEVLDHKAHNSLIFEVEWTDSGNFKVVSSARVFSKKSRGSAPFDLELDYFPSLYLIREKDADDDPDAWFQE